MSSRTYTIEFKKQAVELAEKLGNVSKAADQLGIPDVNIHSWKKKFSDQQGSSVSSATGVSSEQEEIRKLRKEIAELKQVNLVLKTAAAFFSQDHLKKNTS